MATCLASQSFAGEARGWDGAMGRSGYGRQAGGEVGYICLVVCSLTGYNRRTAREFRAACALLYFSAAEVNWFRVFSCISDPGKLYGDAAAVAAVARSTRINVSWTYMKG